jgi:FtsP/CotA-like multicopper oxidase with cupredoxin domain
MVAIDPAMVAEATSGQNPYTVPLAVDTNPDANIFETSLVAAETQVDIGGGVLANAMTFNGAIPGPEFHLTVGERVIVHFQNDLPEETGIHWHGVELANLSDGTPFTQNQVAPGHSYLYSFVVSRPGIFWYHPHHEFSNNQVFKGLYGSIIVTDPNEAALIADGTIPGPAQTMTLAMSDITVCKEPGHNDAKTYDPSLPWVGGGPLPEQPSPWPTTLCDTPIDNHGDPLADPLNEHDVPNVEKDSGRVNEGQTVLTNGMNVGGRGGDPSAPGALDPGAFTHDVQPGSGLRLRLGNEAALRFFRLRLTDSAGNFIPIVRIGGEGGLLDDAVLDGTEPGGYDFKYPDGELLLDPGDRADVVVAFPATTGVATLWTEDFPRIDGSGGWTDTPTVPIAHFNVTGPEVVPNYTIGAGTALRSATGDPQEVLPAATDTLLDPNSFSPTKPGLPSQEIDFTNTAGPSIDGIAGAHDFEVDYAAQDHDGSARYAVLGQTLALTVKNTTSAHHPFHLHGFSIQPLTFTACPGAVTSFTFPEPEFLDNLDVPNGCTLTLRVRLDDRPLVDGVTPGGGLGRWVFHCHIFFHHNRGMTSELVVVANDTGNERPYVDADDPSVTADEGQTVTMNGTFSDKDGDPVTLAASIGSVTDNGDGTWTWSHTPPDGAVTQNVYITATDSNGNKGQTTFILDTLNVPPTVTIDAGQATALDEGGGLSVLAHFTDPGDDDPYTATIDFGTGDGPQPATVAMTQLTPPQAGDVTGSFTYGDNGIYTVTVAVTDKDGGTGSAFFLVTVGNVDPDATIDTSGAVLVNGVPVLFADVNVPVALSGNVTDPGSDDITSTWDFDDGAPVPDDTKVSLCNPPDPDPPLSPSVQPRDVDHNVVHAFAAACAYNVAFSALDDDGGSDVATVLVIITGAPSLSQGAGYWQKQYGGQGATVFTQQQLQCYLDIAAALSQVFNEVRDASTLANAFNNIFVGGLNGNMSEQLDRQLLAAWVNFANGAVEWNELLDTNKDKIPDTTFATVMATAEAVRLNPASTRAQLQAQRDILTRINERDRH